MQSVRNELVLLSDYLGDDHNLAVLRETLMETPDEFGSKRDLQALLGLLDRYSAELRVKAETLGKRVYSEKPKPFAARFRGYWEAWHEEARGRPGKLSQRPAVVTA